MDFVGSEIYNPCQVKKVALNSVLAKKVQIIVKMTRHVKIRNNLFCSAAVN